MNSLLYVGKLTGTMTVNTLCTKSKVMRQSLESIRRVYKFTIYNIRTTSSSPCIHNSRIGTRNELFSTNHLHLKEYCRGYSSQDKPSTQFPNIMDFPVFVWPNLLKSLRNWVLVNFIISKYFDRQFSLREFVMGSKKAVEVVSNYIAKGEVNNLSGLVSPEAMVEVKQHLKNFSLRQQSELAVCQDDIFLCFPYEVGIIFEDKIGEEPQKRFVEITMCYHILTGLKGLRDSREQPPLNFNTLPEFQNNMFVVNYRFFRDFTEGVEPNWIINAFNHLKPVTEVYSEKHGH